MNARASVSCSASASAPGVVRSVALCRAIAEPFLEIGNDVACRPADHRNRHARLPNRADDKETVVEIGERAPEARNLLMSGVVSVMPSGYPSSITISMLAFLAALRRPLDWPPLPARKVVQARAGRGEYRCVQSLFNKREWPCHLFKSLTLGGHAKAQLHCGRSDHEDRAHKIAAEDAGTGSGFD